MPNKPQRRSSDLTDKLLRDIIASKPRSKTLTDRKQINSWLRQYFGNVPVEDLQERSPAIMAQASTAHLDFGRVRKPGQALLRIFNPNEKQHGYDSQFTIVETVNDNMPFLVDSVSSAIARSDLTIHMTVHPVMRVRRTAAGRIEALLPPDSEDGLVESWVRFVIDRESDPQHLRVLEHEIQRVLADVRLAVRDWQAMREKMRAAKKALRYGPSGADEEVRNESRELLQWMVDDHFTFLGYREYELKARDGKLFLKSKIGSGLGLLANEDRGGRTVELSPVMRRHARSKEWLIITKANSRSTVHRPSYLDYVGVKKYDKDGNPRGELRFIGLFTSVAYSENPRNIPLLRLKVQRGRT